MRNLFPKFSSVWMQKCFFNFFFLKIFCSELFLIKVFLFSLYNIFLEKFSLKKLLLEHDKKILKKEKK